MTDLIIGFLLSVTVGVVAFLKERLDESGVIGALILGTVLYGFVGWFAFLMLMVFFISSALLGRFNPDKRSGRRTLVQVASNGGVVFILALLYGLYPIEEIYALVLASIAIAASDTWSSEVGRLSKKAPRHILRLTPMKRGLSGGVTLLGLVVSIAAGLGFGLLSLFVLDQALYALGIGVFAFLGSVIDSVLGTIQVKYKDEKGDLTENKADGVCVVSGLSFLDNNGVNFLSNVLGVGLFAIVMLLF